MPDYDLYAIPRSVEITEEALAKAIKSTSQHLSGERPIFRQGVQRAYQASIRKTLFDKRNGPLTPLERMLRV